MHNQHDPETLTLGAGDTKREFARLLEDVSDGKSRVVVQKHGVPVAALVPIADWERLQPGKRLRPRGVFSGLMKGIGAVRPRGRRQADAVRCHNEEFIALGQSLDGSVGRLLLQLENFKRGVAEVTSAKERLELKASELREDIGRLEDEARQSDAIESDEVVRKLNLRRQATEQMLEQINTQIVQLSDQQQKLCDAEARITARIESFRTQKEVIMAQYQAATAHVRAGEAVSAISEELSDSEVVLDVAEFRASRPKQTPSTEELADRPT